MTLKELMAKKAKLAADMRALDALAKKEERGFTSDEKEKWAKMLADINALDEQIERSRNLGDIESQLEQPANDLDPESRRGGAGDEPVDQEPTAEQRQAEYDGAFSALLRSTDPGMSGLSAEHRALLQANVAQMTPEQRAQAVGTGAAGGFTVPQGFGDRLIESAVAFGGIMGDATIIRTESGNDMPFAGNDDTGNAGTILSENTQNPEQDTDFTQRTLSAYMYTSRTIRVPYQLLQDSHFDMNAYLARKLGERIGRATAAHFATGTGTAQPEGITVGAGGNQDAAAAAAIGFDDLLGLEHQVDPAYRAMDSRFVFNDNTLKLLKGTSDGEGRPLWLPALAGEVPASIYGHPYTIDQGMPNVSSGNVSVVFGNVAEYYVREVIGVQLLRLVERYADFFQVGFIAYARYDGKVMDQAALATLTHP